MMSGRNHLDYNLYTSADRSAVWGDGHGGSQLMTVRKNKVTTLSVYGQIPAGQDVAIGTYTDPIVATVTF
jgi:spore coat protein U-like protein